MFCGKCGKENVDATRFCIHCGADMTKSRPSSRKAPDTLDGVVTLGGAGGGPQYDTLDAAVTQGKEASVLAAQYRIVKKIGEGGMGVVYLAEDMELSNRQIAIKVLPPLLSRNIRAVENLRKEALTAIKLNHPNIIRLHGFHSDGDIKFLVMEYVDGQTLEESIVRSERGRMTVEEALPIAEKVAGALDYAHSQEPPVFHRDLKPSNVMISKKGRVKLLDFGIAREMKDSYTRVTGQETSGTIPYMSPQQINGDEPTADTDIYSLGATLYECLSGHTPFYTGDIRHQILNKKPPDIEGVPGHINRAVQAALAKNTQDRPQTATSLVQMLRQDAFGADKRPHIQTEPDEGTVTARIRQWVENRKADWKEDEWKDFALSLYDDGFATGMSQKKLETIRDHEKKAWIKADEARKAEEARIAEERRRAAEEAERKRREAEEARKRREEEQLFEEVKSSASITLCERYLKEYPNGRYDRKVCKILNGLKKQRSDRFKLARKVAIIVVVGSVGVYAGISVLRKIQSPGPSPSRKIARPSNSTQNSASKTTAPPSDSKRGKVVENSIDMKLVYVPADSFTMGSPSTEADRSSNEQQHPVRISKGFWMGQTEVTQAQWDAVMKTTVRQQRDKGNSSSPLRGEGPDYPMYYVSWIEARDFCERLSRLDGKDYRLPTEAEWEYACRAGSAGRYCFGDSDSGLDSYAWYSSNSGVSTHPVGEKNANTFGLYDMHGNVWEWCSDYYDSDYYSKSPASDPPGPSTGVSRVVRGGSWYDIPRNCRSAYRARYAPGHRTYGTGFRVVVLDF